MRRQPKLYEKVRVNEDTCYKQYINTIATIVEIDEDFNSCRCRTVDGRLLWMGTDTLDDLRGGTRWRIK